MTAGRFWMREVVDIDLAGLDAETNTWPMTESLDGSATLRRTIANVWFEVQNPVADFEKFLQTDGVIFSILIWPSLESPPGGGALIDPGPSVFDNRMIAWGAGPGERTGDIDFGVHRYRYPAGGAPFHVDVQAQRLPFSDPGSPYTPWVSWNFDRGNSTFDDATHARIRVESAWLMDRP